MKECWNKRIYDTKNWKIFLEKLKKLSETLTLIKFCKDDIKKTCSIIKIFLKSETSPDFQNKLAPNGKKTIQSFFQSENSQNLSNTYKRQ